MIAIVRVRGIIGTSNAVEDTLRMLHLFRKNYCTVIEDTPRNRGMVLKVKDFVTWGVLDDKTGQLLGEKSNKPYIRLNSPRKGFGRKGIKQPFSRGGGIGDRKEKINDLIQRMM
ncbi:uL30 family ribosomal protein [Candidatus Woesearchaeota archaeon]|nr:uL30 family ribosomal protein [Candidatus Woesearchaeota archaeon]